MCLVSGLCNLQLAVWVDSQTHQTEPWCLSGARWIDEHYGRRHGPHVLIEDHSVALCGDDLSDVDVSAGHRAAYNLAIEEIEAYYEVPEYPRFIDV